MSETQWRRSWAALGIALFIGLVLWVLASTSWNFASTLDYAVSGLGPGSAAALVGVGLVLTYQTTGIFNFGFGAVATFCAYVIWQLVAQWGWPLWAGAIVAIGLTGPGLGLLFERLVFRPLQKRSASTSEKLLATIAIFAIVLGFTVIIWGLGAQQHPPALFGAHAFHIVSQSFVITSNTAGEVGVIIVAAIAVTLLLQRTRLGRQMRAVVDRRLLAELVGVRANRVAAIAWAIGGLFAALAGVLSAPQQGLAPGYLTLVILEVFAVVVIARLASLSYAIIGGLGLGVVQGLLVAVQGHLNNAWLGFSQVGPYPGVLALLVFLVIWRDLDELGAQSSATGLVATSIGARRQRRAFVGPGTVAAIVLVLIGLGLHNSGMRNAQQMIAYTVIFLSIVAITGFSGHITLGQAAYAGLGALLTLKLSNGALPGFPKLNGILAMLLSAAFITVFGFITGYQALRRRGLILALTTLGVSLFAYFFIFENNFFMNGTRFENRPTFFGVSLSGDRAFYYYELVVLAVALVLTSSLRSGRLGRVLAAMRDSEVGAASIGISLRRYKLFIFAASAFLAALGGSLLVQQAGSFGRPDTLWSPLQSLFWFLFVVFAGLSYLSGAALGAIFLVGLDAIAKQADAAVFVIGFLALITIGFLRGGLVGWLLSLRGRRPGARIYLAALAARPGRPAGDPAVAAGVTRGGAARAGAAGAARVGAAGARSTSAINGGHPYAASPLARRLLAAAAARRTP